MDSVFPDSLAKTRGKLWTVGRDSDPIVHTNSSGLVVLRHQQLADWVESVGTLGIHLAQQMVVVFSATGVPGGLSLDHALLVAVPLSSSYLRYQVELYCSSDHAKVMILDQSRILSALVDRVTLYSFFQSESCEKIFKPVSDSVVSELYRAFGDPIWGGKTTRRLASFSKQGVYDITGHEIGQTDFFKFEASFDAFMCALHLALKASINSGSFLKKDLVVYVSKFQECQASLYRSGRPL